MSQATHSLHCLFRGDKVAWGKERSLRAEVARPLPSQTGTPAPANSSHPEPSQLPCPPHLPHRAAQHEASGEAVSKPSPPPLPPGTGSTRPGRLPAAAWPTSSPSRPPLAGTGRAQGRWGASASPPRPTAGGLAPGPLRPRASPARLTTPPPPPRAAGKRPVPAAAPSVPQEGWTNIPARGGETHVVR